jgi:adenylate cyclase
MGNLIFGSPLAMATGLKSVMEMCLGIDGWKADADAAIAIAAPLDPISHVNAIMWKYVSSVPIGAVAAGATALAETADALRLAEQTGRRLHPGPRATRPRYYPDRARRA